MSTAPAHPCVRCQRLTARTNLRRRAGGALLHGAHGMCASCYRITRRHSGNSANRFGARATVDIDEVVVLRVCRGERLPMNAAERVAIVKVLTRRGHSSAEIAERSGLAPRSVNRIRARLRETSAA